MSIYRSPAVKAYFYSREKKYVWGNDGKADLHNYKRATGWDALSIDFW